MNLGQMMLTVGAVLLLGLVILTVNRSVLDNNNSQNSNEFALNAVSIATSLVEEASGKMFDQVIADSNTTALSDPTQLSLTLGPDGSEAYHSAGHEFNDFDDFNGLKLVYRNPVDVGTVPGYNSVTLNGLRTRYYATVTVCYVANGGLNGSSAARTWNKRIQVAVTGFGMENSQRGGQADTLVYSAIQSCWN